MKRNLSVALLFLLMVTLLLYLASCIGSESVYGFSVSRDVLSNTYNSDTGYSDVEIGVRIYNENPTREMRSCKYKIIFRDSDDSMIYSETRSLAESLIPGEQSYETFSFSGNSIKGEVDSIEVVPLEMVLNNKANESDDGNGGETSSGAVEWDFWTWLWVIISAILILIFFLGCIGAEWDSSAVLGGIIVCVVPAIIILSVYFGFFFGH